MSTESTANGKIEISPQVIASIAYQATVRSYGVVGMASRNLVNGLAHMLVNDPTRGVEVHYDGDQIDIDLYIIVEYGTRIKSVAASVAKTVRFQVERTLGLPVHEVNVHIQGLRISDTD